MRDQEIPPGGGVTDVISSLTAAVHIHFDCSEGSPVNSVNIDVSTQLSVAIKE